MNVNKQMNPPKILLIGVSGVYNYGCEAIVRGTETIIRSEYPNVDIIYASSRPTDDQTRLLGSQVKLIKRKKLGRYSIKNIFRKLLSMVGIRWSPIMDSMQMIEDVNAVLSIGGDIYKLSPSGDYSFSFPKFGDACIKKGVLYILWGASVGPFSDNLKAKREYTTHLKNISLITAREIATVKYLQKLGVSDNVVPCADPAFVVAPEIKAAHIAQKKGLSIGVNLSPLSISYTNASLEESIYTQASAIEGLIKTLNTRIVLIPHVVCDFNEADDDLRYLRQIQKNIAPKYLKSVTLISDDLGFIGIKKELIKCDLIIAARMHCAINALAAHVPTILVSYSLKAAGMCQYVYGDGSWVIALNEFTSDNVLGKVRLMINQQQRIRAYLAERVPEIQQDAHRPMQMLGEMLKA